MTNRARGRNVYFDQLRAQLDDTTQDAVAAERDRDHQRPDAACDFTEDFLFEPTRRARRSRRCRAGSGNAYCWRGVFTGPCNVLARRTDERPRCRDARLLEDLLVEFAMAAREPRSGVLNEVCTSLLVFEARETAIGGYDDWQKEKERAAVDAGVPHPAVRRRGGAPAHNSGGCCRSRRASSATRSARKWRPAPSRSKPRKRTGILTAKLADPLFQEAHDRGDLGHGAFARARGRTRDGLCTVGGAEE